MGIDGSSWAEIVEKVKTGEMPPEDEEQPGEGEIASVISQLDTRIREGRAARMAAPARAEPQPLTAEPKVEARVEPLVAAPARAGPPAAARKAAPARAEPQPDRESAA